jgi:hypothetical protein
MLVDRLLLTAEGDAGAAGASAGEGGAGGASGAGAGGAGAGAGAGGNAAAAPVWYAPAESLKTSDPEIWQSFEKSIQSGAHKDMPGVVKHLVSLEKKLGSALTLPNKDKADEISAFKSKLYQAGIFQAPPESPDKYDIKLDAIPEPLRSEPTVKAVRDWAHKHGLTNDAVSELINIESQRYETEIKPVIELDRKKSQEEFDVWAATTGKESKALQAYGGAWLAKNITEQEMQALERAGIADHPALLKLVAKAGMDTGEDISVVEGTGDPTADSEFNEILRMTTDPTHPDYKLWWNQSASQDPKRIALQEKYEAAFKRKYGTGEAS